MRVVEMQVIEFMRPRYQLVCPCIAHLREVSTKVDMRSTWCVSVLIVFYVSVNPMVYWRVYSTNFSWATDPPIFLAAR